MKLLLAGAAALMLASTVGATAQSAGPTYDTSIHQSAGDRDSRGYPKYYQRSHRMMRHPYLNRYVPETTGAGPRRGPYYDHSIHQSAGDRDSRGYPKYNQERSPLPR